MGMDVYGRKPRSERGKYFRNNAWWWRPLWRYCLANSAVACKVKYGQSNDGDGLNAKDSKILASDLSILLSSGATAQYAANYKQCMDTIADEECHLCAGTGIRTDAIGVANGFVERQYCNGCEGKGKRRPAETWYLFNEENVREFVAFLQDCGGFKIL